MNESRSKPLIGILLGVAALAVIVTVILWGQNGPTDGQSDSAPTLVIGFDEAPRSSDPRLIGYDANSQYLEELRFLPLVSFDELGKLKPIVAESITPEGDRAFVIKLRTGLRFADGDPITPHDVVATYKSLIFPENAPPSPRKGAFSRVESVFKTGPSEVRFALKEPDAAFPTNLVVGILPEKAFSQPIDEINGKGYESGPYILADKTDQQWILKRNDNFDGSAIGIAKPAIERVKILIIRDETTRYAALMRGDIDVLQNGLDSDKVVSLQKNADFKVMTFEKLGVDYLGFNASRGVFKDPAVRLALAHGINRDEILEFALQGLGEKATGMFPPRFEWSIPLPEVAYDPQKAGEILDQASYPIHPEKKERFTFTLKVTTSRTRIAIAKAIAASLEKIGVKVIVESLEFGVFMDQLRDGVADAWLASWTGYKDPDHLHFVFHSAMVPPNGANRGRFRNPILDQLLAAGKSEPDERKRHEIYLKSQEIISSETPYVFLWHPKSIAIVKNGVAGFRMYSDGRYLSLPEVTKN